MDVAYVTKFLESKEFLFYLLWRREFRFKLSVSIKYFGIRPMFAGNVYGRYGGVCTAIRTFPFKYTRDEREPAPAGIAIGDAPWRGPRQHPLNHALRPRTNKLF